MYECDEYCDGLIWLSQHLMEAEAVGCWPIRGFPGSGVRSVTPGCLLGLGRRVQGVDL